MPNGRYESPLNKLADALPNFILQMQNMKMRQDATEALNSYRWGMLEEQRQARIALETVRREMGYFEPPEVKMLRDNISQELRILNDPDNDPGNEFATHPLEDKNVIKRWGKVKDMEANHFGKTNRHIMLSIPISVEGALARIEAAKPPPSAIITPVEGKPKPRVFETKEEYQKRISEPPKPPEPKRPPIPAYRAGYAPPPSPAGALAVEPAVEVPPEFPDPSGFPEGQTATFNGEPWIIRNGQWVEDK